MYPNSFWQQLTIFKDDTHTVDGVEILGPSSGILAAQATCSTQKGRNAWVRSEEADNAFWIKSSATITPNIVTGPDGALTADKLIEAVGAGIFPRISGPLTGAADNTLQTVSWITKAAGRTWCYIDIFKKDGAQAIAWFDLATGLWGTIGSGMTVFAENWGNGWWRIGAAVNILSGATAPIGQIRPTTGNNVTSYTGDGVSGIYIIGAQWDKDVAEMSTYIKTVADPAFPRPALIFTLQGVNREVNLLAGTASIGALNIEVQDNRRLAGQDTGWFTQLLADAGGKNQLVGQRIVLQQNDPWSGLYVVFDGLMDDFILAQTNTKYTITTRDMRERERTLRLFYRAETSVIWPYNNPQLNGVMGPGVAGGYGRLNPTDPVSPQLIPDSKGVKAAFRRNNLDASAQMGIFSFYDRPKVRFHPDNEWFEHFQQYHVFSESEALRGTLTTAQGSQLNGYYNTGFTVQWRVWGSAGAWTTLRSMPDWSIKNGAGQSVAAGNRVNNGGPVGTFAIWMTRYVSSGGLFSTGTSYSEVEVMGVVVSSVTGTGSDLPANDQDIEVRVLSGLPPSERAPMHIETTFGTFLKNAYDGVYSSQPNDIRYSGIDETGPPFRAIITKLEPDGKSWLEENWYKPLGMFPLITDNGEITPRRWGLPSNDVVLPILNDNNTESAEWKSEANDAVNKVSFTYLRDFLDREKKLSTIEVIMDQIDAPGNTRIGDKPVTYAPVTVRDVTTNPDGGYGLAIKTAELGWQLFKERVHDTIDRWSLGGQRMSIVGLRSDPVVRALKSGDWAQATFAALPDYVTKLRGTNRVVQIIQIQDNDPVRRHMIAIDGGPDSVPLTAPTVTSAVMDAAGRIDVTLAAVPAGSDVKVEYVVAAAAPGANDRRWGFLGRRLGVGVVKSNRVPAGNAYVRARSERPGYRPSAWSANTNLVIPSTYAVLGARLYFQSTGEPMLLWTPQTIVPGIRLYYQILVDGVTPTDPLPLVVHVDGSLGQFELPVVPPGSVLYLDVEGWSTFIAGVAGGTQGHREHLIALPNLLDQSLPVIDIQMVTSDINTVTYKVQSVDPTVLLFVAFADDAFPAAPNLVIGADLVVAKATNAATDRLARVKAVHPVSGLSVIVPLIADYDLTPGLAVSDTKVPIFSGPVQIGWRVSGTVDDDCRALLIQVSTGLVRQSVTPVGTLVGSIYWSDTRVSKNWSIDLLQDPGASGTLTLTPREFYNTADGGAAGPPVALKLERPAIIVHSVRDLSSTLREVTLSVTPATARITYTVPGIITTTTVNGPVATFSFDVEAAARTVEYYSTALNGLQSQLVKLTLDQDNQPGITSMIVTEEPANVLNQVMGFDDDVVAWRSWARRNAWPTHNGLVGGTPLEEFLRHPGDIETLTIKWRASGSGDGTSTWYIITRAYDPVGNYIQSTTTKLVSGAPPAVGSLSGLNVVYAAGYNVIDWSHNQTAQDNAYTVTVRENGVQLVTLRDVKLEPDGLGVIALYGGYRTPKVGVNPTDPGAEYLTFDYEVDLRRSSDSALIATYTDSVSGWYQGGGGGGSAPAETPGTPTVTFPSNPAVPEANWSNTSSVWNLTIQWDTSGTEVGGYTLVSTVNLDPATTTNTFPFPPQPWVRCRVRYYNAFGVGTWSGYSTPVQSS